MLRYVFYTFRPHPLDLQKFEDYLTLLIPFVESHEHYAFSVEKDDTPDRHIHALMGSPKYKDFSKFTQAYNGKKRRLNEYTDMITRGKQTSAKHGWDTRLLPDTEDDFQKTLGYIYKDVNVRSGTNFPVETFTASVEYYWAARRLDAPSPHDKNWILVTKKNALQHIPDFVKKYQEKYNLKGYMDRRLPFYMAKERYCLVDLSPKNYEVILQTLSIEHGEHHEAYDAHLCNIYGPFGDFPSDTFYIDRCEELHNEIKLLKAKADLSPDEKLTCLKIEAHKQNK